MSTRCLCQKADGAPRCAVCPLPGPVYQAADRLDGKVTWPPRQLSLDLKEKQS